MRDENIESAIFRISLTAILVIVFEAKFLNFPFFEDSRGLPTHPEAFEIFRKYEGERIFRNISGKVSLQRLGVKAWRLALRPFLDDNLV